MPSHRRMGAAFGALFLLVLSSCVDSGVVTPAVDVAGPSFAISDGSTGGNPDFYFLPPISDENPIVIGQFNPDVLPAIHVCELEMLMGDCVAGPPVADFPAGSAMVDGGHYSFSWDTGGPETGNLNANRYYRLEVLLGSTVLGWIELDPQRPNGPGQSTADAYAFKLGETIPVKFWVSTQVLCEGAGYVTECITGAVIDETGGNLSLENQGNKLGVIVFEGGLPGENHPPITVTLERIDPVVFLAATGEECIPMFDAPQFADCFRITTDPVLDEPLDLPALVSICMDPSVLDGVNLPEEQENQLTMIRYYQGAWEGLPDAAGDCPVTEAGLLRVPEGGLLRYAARALNTVAGLVLPQPVYASDIRFGGFTSSFSRFRYALPGQMIPTAGDGTVLQVSDPAAVDATVLVVDHDGVPVEDAVVHFESADGTLSAPEATSDADGMATVTWTVDKSTAGDKILTVTALGLTELPVPDHAASRFFTAESVDFTATVVGAPASVTASPTEAISGTVGEPAGTLSITVYDAAGYPVSGAGVAWSGDGTFSSSGTATAGDGTSSVVWTLGNGAGEQTATATVGTLTAQFTANAAPGTAAVIVPAGGGSAPIGSVVPISIGVQDAFGNPREGDAVVWTVTSGGGSVIGDATTDAGGAAGASWTVGSMPGTNTASVSAAGLQASFTVEGVCSEGYGAAQVDGVFGPEWVCAMSLPFEANISGGATDAVVYWMNDSENLYLAVRVLQSSMNKFNSVRFDFDNDADGVVEADDDVIGYDADAGIFLDESLSQSCVNKNQSGCSVGGEPVDGAGAVGNDGTWTTFELSHPLDSGDPKDFSVAAGDMLGHFLTLRIGNGAQGNTQFPGFRVYTNITIVGG